MTNLRARLDAHAEIEALVAHEGRAAGSDAERRAASHLAGRLHGLGRDAEVDSIAIWPRWPLLYVVHALLGVAGSLLSVSAPVAGTAVAGGALVSAIGDATGLFRPLRRLLGRRASQNVLSREGGEKDGVLILVAHADAGSAGAIFARGLQERLAAFGDRIGRPVGPIAGFTGLLAAVTLLCGLRILGLEGTLLTALQFLPTVLLLVATVAFADLALSGTVPGASDNASGVVTVLRLAERFGGKLEHFDLWVLFTGAQEPFSLGMRAFLRSHREELDRERTVVVNVDEVGAGTVRFGRREGLLLPSRTHPQLYGICEQIAEDDEGANAYSARPLTLRSSTDAAAAGARGYPAITVTARNALGYAPHHHLVTDVPGRIDGESLERAFGFASELVERLDGQVGPDLRRP